MYHGERFNAWTHLVGTLLATTGASWLLRLASQHGSLREITSVAVYGTTMVLLYMVSTVYHSVRGPLKILMRKLDHLSIYLVIAGSYTPFCLISLNGAAGWALLATVWALAILGMVQEMNPRSEARVASLVIYAVMGWLILVVVDPLTEAMGQTGLAWLMGGGALYTIGVVFFIFDERFRHWHGIWHLFVMAGSLLQFVSVTFYVLPWEPELLMASLQLMP